MQADYNNRHLKALSSSQRQDNTFPDIMKFMIGKLSNDDDHHSHLKIEFSVSPSSANKYPEITLV